ncbi:hypothetical protein SAMN05660420_02674 [Desulfuromusa kysingii]|uniref:DUF5666 domain-containing protein n=1 Tax=Desulfuromusa kysingii TaxID=37625 RepID=A0A1H4CQQ1_9BACT|nr:hypothetical protein [Desulfuromusa kysingii]SEA62735.1 hypothetical protein SAMN05660420_02674 [Desulfuromusa kysingii]
MKKTLALIAALAFVISISGTTFAADFKGKVTKVKGKTVTIEITKGKASKLKVGTKVEIEADESKGAPKKGGGSMLQGC